MANIKNLAKIGLSKMSQGPRAVADKVQIKKPFIDVKDKNGDVQKKLGNFYTGKKINPLYVGGAGAAYLVGKQTFKDVEKSTIGPLNLATKNDYQHLGAPDVMMYDGVGQERAPSNMNAEGNLVFGLHNMRKG
ncbi:hypothetical protein ABFV99_14140 [Cytobacillus horneckiae]|uniref:hypothetical protein n=1 Tax=Cytobacillus horneckiae TaxID=549687 RepID=UPI0034CDAFA0